MDDFRALIKQLGGAGPVARAAGKESGTGRQWKLRGYIPVDYWPALVDLAARQGIPGVTLDKLASLAIERPRKGRAA